MSVLRNCLFVELHACSLFRIVFAITCFPHFLQSFCSLFDYFFCQIVHVCTLCFYAGSLRCNLLDLSDFLSPLSPFCCFANGLLVLLCYLLFPLPCYNSLWFFLCSFQCCIFLLYKAVVCINCVCSFCFFFLHHLTLLCSSILATYMQMPRVPLTSPNLSLFVLSDCWIRYSYFVALLWLDHTCKTRPRSHNMCLFSACFPVPPCPCDPLHPSVPMWTHPESYVHFFCFVAKHDVRGNFPGHRGRKHVLFAHVCLCLPCFAVCSCPYTPPHPWKPIRTHLHPHVPVHTLNCNK